MHAHPLSHGHRFHHCNRRAEHDDSLGGGRGHRGGGDGPRGGRVFGHGGLRFVLLQLIADKPSHGYELIKSIEDRLGGAYSPSPGTVYPTLTLMEELGYLTVEEADAGGRKRYCITDAGQAFLAENRATADAMLARMQGGVDGAGPRAGRPPQVMRAIENLKLAMRMRLAREALTPAQANAFAAVLDHAAQQLEQI
jgi:DNA-binding PadR family transcriptional regulator